MNSNETQVCDPLDLYDPGEPATPAALLWMALVHCYCVAVFGTLGNALALWCVWTCTKTRRPVKVLHLSVFLPVLVTCLATRPVVGEVMLALLTCDPHRISKTVLIVKILGYSILAQIELAAIAVVAVIRVVAVWSVQRFELRMRVAATLVFCVFAYSLLTGIVILGAVVTRRVDKHMKATLELLYFFLHTMVPLLITVAAYALMIVAVQRNKRCLVASQQQTKSVTTMDQATRAMLAVFISNLVFGLPHSIYHLMGRQPHYMHVIFHVLFSTHFVVDPLVFVYFNLHNRRRVLDLLGSCWRRLSCQLTATFPKVVFSVPMTTHSSAHVAKNTTRAGRNVSR